MKLESNFLRGPDRPFCNSWGKLHSQQLTTQAMPVILTLLLQASAGNINAQSPAFPCSTRTPQYCAGAVNPITKPGDATIYPIKGVLAFAPGPAGTPSPADSVNLNLEYTPLPYWPYDLVSAYFNVSTDGKNTPTLSTYASLQGHQYTSGKYGYAHQRFSLTASNFFGATEVAEGTSAPPPTWQFALGSLFDNGGYDVRIGQISSGAIKINQDVNLPNGNGSRRGSGDIDVRPGPLRGCRKRSGNAAIDERCAGAVREATRADSQSEAGRSGRSSLAGRRCG